MVEILKIVDTKGDIKIKDMYNLLKTNSPKINFEIAQKIQTFNKIDEFFNHYSIQTSLFELLNKVEFNSSKNYDGIFSSFDLNIEQYISCFTQMIISIKLILKTQEILNKIFLTSKKYLLKLKIEQQIENISQDNLFSFIEKLLDISLTSTLGSFSNSSSKLRFDSFDSINNNLLYHQKLTSDHSLKSFSRDDLGKTLKILNEEPCTPKFGSNSDTNFQMRTKENFKNICIRKDSSFSLSDEEEINSFEKKEDAIKNKKNNFITKKDDFYNKSVNERKYECLLKMINDIYKKGIINSEEKIRLKQLVIAKSKKLENLYYNIYKNKSIDENVLRSEITKLLN